MTKILILKNDRVGDLMHSIYGINAIINENFNSKIEIILSNYSKDLLFLFKIKNIKVRYLNYNLNIFDKLFLLNKIIFNKYTKIYILSPKNFYFFLPLFSNAKFYGVCVKDFKRSRPMNFLKNLLHKFVVNNRVSKKPNESITNLIFNLCANNNRNYNNVLNNNPKVSFFVNQNSSIFKNFLIIHYKHYIFKKNGWSIDEFVNFLNEILNKSLKIILTSDLGNFTHNQYFLDKFSYLNFDKNTSKYLNNKNIFYLHNIKMKDLFTIMKLSNHVISPHGTMTALASYLKKNVIDIFDTTISINSFREFKPNNPNYKFLILKDSSDRTKKKIINLL